MLRSASRLESSMTYTFIPPASPVPGWSSGDVCRLIMATRPWTGRAPVCWAAFKIDVPPDGPTTGGPCLFHPAREGRLDVRRYPGRDLPEDDASEQGQERCEERVAVLEVRVDLPVREVDVERRAR